MKRHRNIRARHLLRQATGSTMSRGVFSITKRVSVRLGSNLTGLFPSLFLLTMNGRVGPWPIVPVLRKSGEDKPDPHLESSSLSILRTDVAPRSGRPKCFCFYFVRTRLSLAEHNGMTKRRIDNGRWVGTGCGRGCVPIMTANRSSHQGRQMAQVPEPWYTVLYISPQVRF